MKKNGVTIACGLLFGIVVTGCSGEGGASVPQGFGADTASKENAKPGEAKSKKAANLSSALD